MYICKCIYVYTYIYIYIYTYIHVYIYICMCIHLHLHFERYFVDIHANPQYYQFAGPAPCKARDAMEQRGWVRSSWSEAKKCGVLRCVVRCALCEEVTCDESVSLIGHGGMEVVQIYFPHKWTFGRCCFNVGTPLWICLSHTAIRINGLEWAWQRRHSGFSWVYVGQFLWVWHISQRDLLNRLWKSVKG